LSDAPGTRIPAQRQIGEMGEQGKQKTAGDHGCRRAGERKAQGEKDKRSCEQRAHKPERRGTRPTNEPKAQNRHSLKRDEH
jgi:hypothetical protein